MAGKRKADSESMPTESVGTKTSQELPHETPVDGTAPSKQDRLSQLRALRLRMKDSKKQNRHDLYKEHSRLQQDPKALKAQSQKASIATEKLAKLDALEAGEDFERKRAWDWTVEESERWDEELARRAQNKADAGFADFAQEAAKQYVRNTGTLKPDLEAYKASTKAGAGNGTLLTAAQQLDHLEFVNQKPSEASVDKLVADLSRADAARLKAQIKRGRAAGDEGDYINERNKVFNQKVARFYDKHTREMKDAFERGTAQ